MSKQQTSEEWWHEQRRSVEPEHQAALAAVDTFGVEKAAAELALGRARSPKTRAVARERCERLLLFLRELGDSANTAVEWHRQTRPERARSFLARSVLFQARYLAWSLDAHDAREAKRAS